MEVLAGEKAKNDSGEWLPEATLRAIDEYSVAIKGPLTTPVGGGIRSLNVTLRQVLDLYACVRPVRYFTGVPSPVKTSREDGRRHIPRKHRRRVRRHRVGAGHTRGDEGYRVPERPDGPKSPGRLRHRDQAHLGIRKQAPGAQGYPARHRPRQVCRHPRAQGKHHEVHGRRIPRLGLSGRPRGIRRPSRSAKTRSTGITAGRRPRAG